MDTVNKKRIVREQYKTADNLNTRISIHAKYSVNKMGFGNWIFSHYDLQPGMKILDIKTTKLIREYSQSLKCA